MTASLFLALLVVAGAAHAALGATVRFTTFRSRSAVLKAVVAILVPAPPVGRMGLTGRFRRSLASAFTVMPSGRKVACCHVQVVLSHETLERLAPNGDANYLARDALMVYRDLAVRNSWEIPGPLEVSIRISDRYWNGRIPPARMLGEPPERGSVEAVARDADRTGPGDNDVDPLPAAPASISPGTDTVHHPGPTAYLDESHLALGQVHRASEGPTGLTSLPARRSLNLYAVDGGYRVQLHEGKLGRHPECATRLDEASVSAIHAGLQQDGDGWVITDLGSTVGTWVNGVRVPAGGSAMLRPGRQLVLGRARYLVEATITLS